MEDIAMAKLGELIMAYVKDVLEKKHNKIFLLEHTKTCVSTVVSRLITEENIDLTKIKFFIREDRDSSDKCIVEIRYINNRSIKSFPYDGPMSIDSAAAYLETHPKINLIRLEANGIPLEKIYGNGFLAARRRNEKYSVTVCRRSYPDNSSLIRVKRSVSDSELN